jgi:hypothetical protein
MVALWIEQCGQAETKSLLVNLALQMVLTVGTDEIKTLSIAEDFDDNSSSDAGEAAEGGHLITFLDRKELGVGHSAELK